MSVQLRVIEGGRGDGAKPIIWSRLPPEGAPMVITSDQARTTLAIDAGELLVGLREISRHNPRHDYILQAWIDGARGEGREIRDEREPEPVQGLIPGVAPVPAAASQIAALQARKAARRGGADLPAGGLFDDTARDQLDLF